MNDAEIQGFWRATDQLLSWINSLDTEHMTPAQVRSAFYAKLIELRPRRMIPMQITIGLSGYAKSGKTTAADFIEAAYGVKRCHVATPLRAMLLPLLRAYQVPEEMIPRYLEGDLKETVIPGIGRSGRYLQISLGTEWGRELVGDDLWAGAWALLPEPRKMNDSVRFPNEESHCDFTILIRRRGTHPIAFKWGRFGRFLYHRLGLMWGVHDSERTDRLRPDHIVDNDGSIEELHARLAYVVETEMAQRGLALR